MNLVRRYVELYNTGNMDLADEVIAADFVDHTHLELRPGPEDVKKEVTTFRAVFLMHMPRLKRSSEKEIQWPFVLYYEALIWVLSQVFQQLARK
jgi:hypothetical protein